jgi:Lanthionine synthetase C-like protein/HopA1 effector protein family
MTRLHHDLFTVLDAVQVESSTRFALLGETQEVLNASTKEGSADEESANLTSVLGGHIYVKLYIKPSVPELTPHPDILDPSDLVAALASANTGRGTWEPGWVVQRIEPEGKVVALKDGLAFWVQPTGLRASGDAIRPGESCRAWVPNEFRRRMLGFYFAVGDEEEEIDETDAAADPRLRYYWHLRSSAAVPFVAAATSLLNGARIPFALKVLTDAREYHRADAGVLYVHARDDPRVGPLIAEIHRQVAGDLRASVPLLTKRLADGLGYAEDPRTSLSFGEHRCRLIAEALWRSFRSGEIDRQARAATLAARFEEEGLDPLRPYLGSAKRDDRPRHLPPAIVPVARIAPRLDVTEATFSPGGDRPQSMFFREAAYRIGEALCRSAYWDQRRELCNWIGRSSDEVVARRQPVTLASGAIGHDLYGGSPGIALFLAQLHALAGGDDFIRTASGAIARSLRQLSRQQWPGHVSPLSFFCGDLGVAYAARGVALLTGQAALQAQAESLLQRVVASSETVPRCLDLIGGNAGAIPVLLALAREAGFESARERAITLGEDLCRSAIPQKTGCAWAPDGASGSSALKAPLTGLSHGAAGIGLALFELYGATGRSDFLEIARNAFAYEESLFSPERGNWPDLRENSGTPGFPCLWCHGAPGILLARLRAAALDPERRETYLAMARIGLATTLAAIDHGLSHPRWDTSLCHGLAGLGEVLLIAGKLLDESSYHARAISLARSLIARHAEPYGWPSGVPSGGPNPSLMLGDAGVGYWFLRLHAPETVPSILLLGTI